MYTTRCSAKQDSVWQRRRRTKQYVASGCTSQFAHFTNGSVTRACLQPLAVAERSAKAMANNDTMAVPDSGAETIQTNILNPPVLLPSIGDS
jgi:hypothetical protein